MRAGWLIPNPLMLRPALGLAIGFFVAHTLSLSLIRFGGPLAPAWPPVGIALAALFALPRSHRPLVFVGYITLDTLSNALQGFTSVSSLSYLAVSLSEIWLAEWILRRFATMPLHFAKVRDVITLLLGTTVATAMASIPAAFIAQARSPDTLLESAAVWWVGDMLAFVIITPLTVLLLDPPSLDARWKTRLWWLLEAAIIGGVLLVGSLWAFLERNIAGEVTAHPYMLTVPVLWATLRFGQIGTLVSVLEIAIVGVLLLFNDQSLALGGSDNSSSLIVLQVFLGIVAMTSLVLATALREQHETSTANAQMVVALTASEQRLRQSQKMEAIGQLAGGVAHDFNNVLAAVILQLEELTMVRDLPRMGRELITDIESSVQRAARLTRQLLVFSRQQAMQPQLLDLNTLVLTHTRLLRRVVPNVHTLTVTTMPEPLVVAADGGMIEQVLLNLVLNARDAQPEGGTIVIATSRREVAAPSSDLQPGVYAVLTVRDSGTGISPEHMARLFEPFFTTKPPGQGTGLGLATAYGIVQQHQGTIRVSSAVGQGTTMDVWLPVTDVPLETSMPAIEELPADSGEHVSPATVLVVEDEATVRRLMQRVLEREGFVVRTASSGREALEQWRSYGPAVDLVLTDLVMPGGVSGTQLARELRRLHPSLPIVFTSGYDPDYDPSDMTMIPGENFIPKPASTDQIVSVVRRQLQAKP